MRLFSSKKICIMIASAGLLFAGVLIGTSVIRQHGARRTFEEEGYVLTMEEDEDQVIVNHENRFSAGSSWSREGLSSVAFRDEDGNRVVVDSDSFIHYDSDSLAAAKDGAISDMDQYLNGVIGSCYLPAGNTLVWDGSSFTAQSSDGEKRFSNFIWKNSEQRYLLGSPRFTIRFSGGGQETSESGFLELYYLGTDKKIMQLTSGEKAWQVVSKDCTVTFDNGVTLNCEDGSITSPSAGTVQETDTAEASTGAQTMSLQNIEIDASGSITLGSTQYSNFQPTFRFTLFDGADGASGTDGAEGAPGEAGEDGEDGEAGTEGTAGAEGAAGTTGSAGTAGGAYTTVINGGVETGVTIKTGIPAIIAPEADWKVMSDGTFKLGYERDAYDTIDHNDGTAYVYLYNVETGEILKEWKNQTIRSEDELAQFSLKDPAPAVTLDMDTTYAIAAIDTYGLGGTNYTTKLFEKIFTTDSTGVQVQLMDRGTDSFTVNVAATGASTDSSTDSNKDYTKIKKVTVTVKNKKGETVRTEEYTDNFKNLQIGKGTPIDTANDPLKSDSWYSMEFSVECTVKGVNRTIKKTLDWTTLKQAPAFGGLSLRSENGYLIAKVLGNYDVGTKEYGAASDPDGTLESITYSLYTAYHLNAKDNTPVTTVKATSTSDVYFRVDGGILSNEAVYYLVAEYTWNDGARSITVPVMESDPDGKTSENDIFITTTSLNGRAFAEKKALEGNGVSMSFSGSGTKLFNVTGNQDSSEGTTYESIKGSISVSLNGMKISVNDTRKLTLEITDNLTYKKKLRFNSCDGKQGDMEGSFALPVDLDGMVAGNTYACTLYGYVYNQSTDDYKYASIATLTIRTDTEKNITMGMRQAENGGTGVDFWLGAEEATVASNLRNYYDQKNSTYVLENGTEDGESDYFANTDASYRNLSSIVFELYNGTNPTAKNLIGTCTVYGTDSNDERASFMPGYSLLYQKYYGSAAFSSGDNSVGVGESFTHKFYYDTANTGQTGQVTETALSGMGDGSFTIVAKVCYDYTWDRYNYTGNDSLYDYITYNGQLEMEDYVNELTVNGGSGATVNILYQERPVAPGGENVLYDNGFALTVDTLENEKMGAYSYSGKTAADNYDPALLDGTAIGVDIGTCYTDGNKLARTLTFYGTTYALAESEDIWPSDQTLTQVKDKTYKVDDTTEPYIFGFKFTLPMTQNGSAKVDDVNDKEKRRSSVPHIWLFTYDDSNTTFEKYLTDNGFQAAPADDRGYSYRKYDEKNDVWLVYSNFLKRGKTYVFAYEADLDFTINDNQGSFSYPGDYYKNGWVTGKKYAKNTTLRSVYTPLLRQIPQVDLELLSSTAPSETDSATGSNEEWNLYLNDPDSAIMADSLLGYNKEYEDAGAIFGISGSEITDDQVGYDSSKSYKQYIKLGFAGASSDTYELQYRVNDTEDLTAKDKVTATIYKDSTEVTEEDTRKKILSDLIASMKKVKTDGSGNVTSAGTTITVSDLNPDGIYYSWKAIYRLLDDYQTKSQQGKMPLITHYFTGHETWKAENSTNDTSHPNNSSFTLSTVSKAGPGGSYTVSTVLDTDTNDIMTVSIPRTEGTQWPTYYADMLKIAGVKITAEKVNNDGTKTQIWAKDDKGNITDTPSAVWTTVSDLGSGEYGFSFRISSLDKSEKGGEAQFNKRDKLIFTYTFYYDNGQRNTAEEIAKNTDDSNLWYAMKSVNGYTGNLALYQRVPATYSKDRSKDEQRRSQNASGSLYHIAATENEADGIKAPSVTRTAVTGNDCQKYIASITQTYTLTEAPLNPTDLTKPVIRYESMRYSSGINGYWNNNVSEFIQLGEVKATASVTVQQIAPTLAEGYKIKPSITQATMDLNIESYNLMDYPGTELLHLYYAVYKETEEIDEDSGEKVQKLTLAGVMIGEADQTGDDGKVKGSRQVIFDKLEKNQTYRLYVYYKDNRQDQADTDATIFHNALESGQNIADLAGKFMTGAQAEKLAACFTNKDGSGKLDPANMDPVNGIQKIMGIKKVVAKKANSETGEEAVYDYYDKFKTSNGIVIESLKVENWGLLSSYMIDGTSSPTGAEGETSGKTLKVTATTSSVQNDHTRMFFVLERCPLDEKVVEENWRTVLYDGGNTSVATDDPNYAPAYPTNQDKDAEGNQSNPEYKLLDAAVSGSGMTKTDFRSYGLDYTYTPLSNLDKDGNQTGTYKATMSFTAYPGYAIEPGYYYRVRAMLFQFDENWEHPSLVSLESKTGEKQYKSSSITWPEYTYNDADKLVKVTNVQRSADTIQATVKAMNKGFSLDNYYYVRLWKHEGNTWVIQEDDKYYGSGEGNKKWNHTALKVGASYTLNFENLDPNTEYQLWFYGLMDTDYDNNLNIRSDAGIPLAAEDDTTEIFGNLTNYYNNQSNNKPQSNLKSLYQKYLNIANYNEADNLKIKDNEEQAAKVLLNTSASITTFKKGQTSTIGEKYQVSKISANTLQIFFQNASGLGDVDSIVYSIRSENGDIVSGTITKQPGNESLMDGGTLTAGNVSLTITNSSLELNNKGTYIVQLSLRDTNGNEIERPATFDFDVD